MNRLDEFLSILCGHFDNAAQVRELEEQGVRNFPFAEHVNTVCQDKITGLPTDFHGKFVLEESYYTTDGKTHASPHLFLFTEEEEGVLLTSYELPKDGTAPTYQTLPIMHYTDLRVSEKFTRRTTVSGINVRCRGIPNVISIMHHIPALPLSINRDRGPIRDVCNHGASGGWVAPQVQRPIAERNRPRHRAKNIFPFLWGTDLHVLRSFHESSLF